MTVAEHNPDWCGCDADILCLCPCEECREYNTDPDDADGPRIGTHWVGCWRSHHECATAIIEQVLDGAIDEGIRRLIQSDGTPDG